VAASLGGLAESNLAMLASMLSMVFSREHTPRPASSSTFFTVFRREETLATITCVCVCVGGGGGVVGGIGRVVSGMLERGVLSMMDQCSLIS